MSPLSTARGSLRMRVMLIPAGILFIGMVAAFCATLFAASARINSEAQSGLGMANLLIGYALDELAGDRDPQAALRRLRRELAEVRHVRVVYRLDSDLQQAFPAKTETAAPGWFLSLFAPAKIAATHPLVVAGVPRGELIVWTWPADEIAEIWSGLVFLAGLMAVLGTAIIALLYSSGRFALKPLKELEDGLDRLEQGNFAALTAIKVSELQRIGERFNRLAASLARSEAQNHRLVDRLMSVQEAERKEIARELHDEYGAALFGIRAAAACILDAAANAPLPEATGTEICGRAATISRLADAIQKQNYQLLDRIEPVVLRQMGLAEAVRHLVETWRTAQRGCTLEFVDNGRLAGVPEDAGLACYRIMQESLTNIARHARATSALVTLGCDGTAIHLTVEDDGIGLPQEARAGFGLLGMNERVRKFGGRFSAAPRPQGGSRIEAFIPLVAEVPSIQPAPARQQSPQPVAAIDVGVEP